jgi:Fe-S-cluster containining protein
VQVNGGWAIPNIEGKCPFLEDGKCVVYLLRPQACRDFDCRSAGRVFMEDNPEVVKLLQEQS